MALLSHFSPPANLEAPAIMFAQIRKAEIEDQSVVHGQLKDYLEELTAIMQRYGLSTFGVAMEPYPYFHDYWKEPTRWPYVIQVNGEPVGFIFINQWSPSGRGTDYAIAEFYIAPRWRGQRHGTAAAHQVLQRHPGQWEVAFFNGNVRAQAFWPAAIMNAGAEAYERVDRPDTTILRFVIVPHGATSR
jgi:predicted acetyltransferase